jgi:hypothetical protein
MFRRGYLELLGITDPSKHHEHLKERLGRYQGLQLVALGCADAAAVRTRWAGAHHDLRPVAEVSRAVPQAAGGSRPATFRIVYLDDQFPEAMLFAIEHVDPDALWQPELLSQPNAVTALRGVTIVSPDPRATAGRLRDLGLDGAPAAGGWRVPLALGGWIDLMAPSDVEARFAGETPPAVPSAIAVTYEVADIDATARHLVGADIAFEPGDGCLRVPAKYAQGCVIEFVTPGMGGGA